MQEMSPLRRVAVSPRPTGLSFACMFACLLFGRLRRKQSENESRGDAHPSSVCTSSRVLETLLFAGWSSCGVSLRFFSLKDLFLLVSPLSFRVQRAPNQRYPNSRLGAYLAQASLSRQNSSCSEVHFSSLVGSLERVKVVTNMDADQRTYAHVHRK